MPKDYGGKSAFIAEFKIESYMTALDLTGWVSFQLVSIPKKKVGEERRRAGQSD